MSNISGGPAGADPLVLELRIHGVSNTPPHSTLDLPEGDIIRADGDELGSFWQRSPKCVNPPSGARGHTPDGVHREAYSWGNLARSTFTAGSGVIAQLVSFLVRTLWTLLLPFAMVNVAYWSRRLHDGDDSATFKPLKKGHSRGAWVLRLSGMSLTLMVTVTAVVLSVDLVGIQCQPLQRSMKSTCTAIPDAVGFIDGWSMGARMAFTSLIPLLLILALFALSARTRTRFELATRNQDPVTRGAPGTRTFPDSATSSPRWPLLSTPGFWNHSRVTAPAATTHLSATIAVVVGLCAEHLRENAQASQSATFLWLILALVAVAVLAWTLFIQAKLDPLAADVACTAEPEISRRLRTRFPRRMPEAPSQARHSLALALLLYAVFVVTAPFQDSASTTRRPMTSTHWAVTVLAVLVVVLTVAALGIRSAKKDKGSGKLSSIGQAVLGIPLAIAIAVLPTWPVFTWLRPLTDKWGVALPSTLAFGVAAILTVWAFRRSRASVKPPDACEDKDWELSERDQTGWGGRGPGVFLALGAFFGFVILSALTLFVGDRINGNYSAGSLVMRTLTGTPTTQATATAGSIPPAPRLVVPGLYGWFAVAAVGGLLLMVIVVAVVYGLWWRKPADDESVPGVPEASPTYRAVLKARRKARIAHRAEPLITVLLVCVLAAGVAIAALRQYPGVSDSLLWTHAITGAAFVLAGATVGVIAGGNTSTSRTAARPLGILWDLACSIPRAAHPLGPPCYGERVVPEVLERCRRWLADGPGPRCDASDLAESPRGVALSAHSLGGVIAVAAILAAPQPTQSDAAAHKERPPLPGKRGDWMVPRLALITYGTQLRAYFGRFFPELFGPAVLGSRPVRRARLLSIDPWDNDCVDDRFKAPKTALWNLRDLLALYPDTAGTDRGGDPHDVRWYSLWRPSDYLGFPALARTKARLEEPVSKGWRALHDGYAQEADNTAYLLSVLTHSDYPRTTAYTTALKLVADDLTTTGAKTTSKYTGGGGSATSAERHHRYEVNGEYDRAVSAECPEEDPQTWPE